MQEKSQKKSLIKQNILQVIDYKGLKKPDFYRKTGITRGILDQDNGISEDNIARFLAIFPDIDANWLVTGEGEMLRPSGADPPRPSGDTIIAVKKSDAGGICIPLIPIDAIAGWNGIDAPGVVLANCENYIIPEFIQAGAEYLIRVSGSSMYPKYSSGDILACKRIREVTFIQWGKIYVIDSAQGAMVKRLFEDKDHADCIVCKSDNEKYLPFQLPKSEIRSLSIVIGVVRLE